MDKEELSPEELKRLIDKAIDVSEKKRRNQASKVGELKTDEESTKEIEKILEKKMESG